MNIRAYNPILAQYVIQTTYNFQSKNGAARK